MKLKSEISVILISKSLLFVIVCALIYYYQVKKAFVKQVQNQLESISMSKKDLLNEEIDKKVEDIYFLTSNFILKNNLNEFNKDPDPAYAYAVESLLKSVKSRISDFECIHIVTPKGNIIMSTDNAFPNQIARHESFRHALEGESCLHEFFVNKKGQLRLYLTSPIYYGKQIIGILMIESDPSGILDKFSEPVGLGSTGSIALARRDEKGNIQHIAATHGRGEDKLSLTKIKGDVMATALQGYEGFFEKSFDSRNEEVLASTRFINKSDWGIVAKIDKKEAYAPLNAIRNTTWMISAITTILLVVSSYLFAEYLVRPIKMITKAVSHIAQGDLSRRIRFRRKNELGTLANSFNQMAEKLTDAKNKLHSKINDLDRSNEALNKFAYVVSHDLKAPLQAIESLSGMLNQDMEENEKIKISNMIVTKVKRMHDLIEGILEYSKVGGANPKQEPVNLNESLNIALENISLPPHIHVNIENELPSLNMDKVCAMQVFQNLISNSIKYMDKPQGFVKVGNISENGHYKFYVADNGPGIDSKYHDKIFDIFTTVHTKSKFESTGVGLAIVKKIVENCGGTIWVESEPDKGAKFFFTLPRNS